MAPEKNKNTLNITHKKISVYYFLILISSVIPFLIFWTIPFFIYKVISLRKLKPLVEEAEIEGITLYKSHFMFMLATQIYFLISVAILSKILALSFSFKVLGLMLFILFAYLFGSRIINGIDAIYKKQPIEKPFNIFGYLNSNSSKKENTSGV